MITLTTPDEINSVLGGNVPVLYDKMVLRQINFQTILQRATATLALTSTSHPEMPEITGKLTIEVSGSTLEMVVDRLDFYKKVNLTSPQRTAVLAIMSDSQDALESGLIALGVIDGAQSTGT